MGSRRTTPSKPRRRRHNKLEFFETPPGFTRLLTRHMHLRGQIYCPTVGEGAIIRAMREEDHLIDRWYFTNDIDPQRPADTHFDARKPEAWSFAVQPDWVVDNPAFSIGYDIVQRGLFTVRLGVVLHLRVSFPEPTLDREEFLTAYPPDIMMYLPRYSFGVSPKTGKRSTDATTTAWCVWLTDAGHKATEYSYDKGWVPAADFPIFKRDSPLFGEDGRARRIIVAPRSVAWEGWHDGRSAEGTDTGVPQEAAGGAPASDPA